jgi:hypothetical protein
MDFYRSCYAKLAAVLLARHSCNALTSCWWPRPAPSNLVVAPPVCAGRLATRVHVYILTRNSGIELRLFISTEHVGNLQATQYSRLVSQWSQIAACRLKGSRLFLRAQDEFSGRLPGLMQTPGTSCPPLASLTMRVTRLPAESGKYRFRDISLALQQHWLSVRVTLSLTIRVANVFNYQSSRLIRRLRACSRAPACGPHVHVFAQS